MCRLCQYEPTWTNRVIWWINRRRYPEQAWYWTPEWQRESQEALLDRMARGK